MSRLRVQQLEARLPHKIKGAARLNCAVAIAAYKHVSQSNACREQRICVCTNACVRMESFKSTGGGQPAAEYCSFCRIKAFNLSLSPDKCISFNHTSRLSRIDCAAGVIANANSREPLSLGVYVVDSRVCRCCKRVTSLPALVTSLMKVKMFWPQVELTE